jgi:photosystem II stability/assembly factor-like uncharacterized protein
MNWIQQDTGIATNTVLSDIIAVGSNLYVAAGGAGVYRSTNNGMSWQSFSNGITDTVLNLFKYKGDLYAGTKGSGLFIKSGNSNSWSQVSLSGLPANPVVFGFYKDGSTLYLALYQYGVYRSTDHGATWTAANNGLIQPPNSAPTTFLKVGRELFVGISNAGVYSTMNDGNSWVKKSEGLVTNGNTISDLTSIGSVIAVAMSGAVNAPGRGIYLSTNKGMTWYAANEGFTSSNDYNVQALEICDTVVIAGTNGAGIWIRGVSDLTEIPNVADNNTTKHSALLGNYPNPFNPVTVISFNLAAKGPAQLLVYDITGRVVNTLVNGVYEPGEYNITFDASELASGIYYYKLVTQDKTETKKMILVK